MPLSLLGWIIVIPCCMVSLTALFIDYSCSRTVLLACNWFLVVVSLITSRRCYMQELHWLPVERRIVFKILLITFKAITNLAHNCICDLLLRYTPGRPFRSETKFLLKVPPSNMKTYGNRSFSVCAPKLWNSPSDSLKDATSVSSF